MWGCTAKSTEEKKDTLKQNSGWRDEKVGGEEKHRARFNVGDNYFGKWQ